MPRAFGYSRSMADDPEEMQRSALRTAVPLYKLSTPQQAPTFHAFMHDLLNKSQWKDFRDYQA